jgi:hypothetical protein
VLYPAELRAQAFHQLLRPARGRMRLVQIPHVGIRDTYCNPNFDWSGQQDSNLRPSAPKADALPDCAIPRNRAAPHGTANHTDRPYERQFNEARKRVFLRAPPHRRTVRFVLEDHTGIRELLANLIGALEVLRATRINALGNQSRHVVVAQRR